MQIMSETAPDMLMNFLRTLKAYNFIMNILISSEDQTVITQTPSIDNYVVDDGVGVTADKQLTLASTKSGFSRIFLVFLSSFKQN